MHGLNAWFLLFVSVLHKVCNLVSQGNFVLCSGLQCTNLAAPVSLVRRGLLFLTLIFGQQILGARLNLSLCFRGRAGEGGGRLALGENLGRRGGAVACLGGNLGRRGEF